VKTNRAGFTLVEMAIVLVIVGLLLGGLLMPLSTQVEQRRISETQKALDEIREALIGFAASHVDAINHPFLPCPDKTVAGGVGTPNDGQEDRNVVGTCVVSEGNLPWATLSVADADSWGNRFHYRVTAAFSNSATGFTLANSGDITVQSSAIGGTAVATNVPVAVLSYGKNGFGATNFSGGINPAPTSADELENTAGVATTFVSHIRTDVSAPAGEFDDIVTWISPNTLYNRMISAGNLP